MSIVLGRVDYRLLHGIVATMWAPQSGAQRVMVIDDRTANDPIIKESMRLGKPAGMACSIITEETAMKNFKAGKYDDHKVFVVCEDPGVFLRLQELSLIHIWSAGTAGTKADAASYDFSGFCQAQ